MNLTRRAALALAGAGLVGCTREGESRWTAQWVGAAHERGHRLRDSKSGSLGAPALTQRASVIVVGAGIAGLAAARGLMRAGVDDLRVLELEDVAGGNSRGHRIAGMGCPLGAHYLPVPGPHAHEVAQLLDELGLRRVEQGRVLYDERHLCHSPQERLFIEGQWVEGLLPPVEALPAAARESTLAQYRRFAREVQRWVDDHAFRMPTARAAWRAELAALAPMVVREAMAGDTAALGIVQKGADDVAELVEAVARKLQMGAPEVCIVGGLLNTGPIIFDSYRAAMLRRVPTADVKTAEQPPVMGAALLALDLAKGTQPGKN